MAQGKKMLNKNKKKQNAGGAKRQLGKTKKGLKKQVKPKKENQIISKSVIWNFSIFFNFFFQKFPFFSTFENDIIILFSKFKNILKVLKRVSGPTKPDKNYKQNDRARVSHTGGQAGHQFESD